MYDGEIHGCCGCFCAQSVDANVRAQKAPSANDVIGVRIAFVTDVINHPHLAKQRPEPGLLDRLDHGMTAFPRSIVKKIICPPARAVTPAFQRPQCRIEPFGNGASRACGFRGRYCGTLRFADARWLRAVLLRICAKRTRKADTSAAAVIAILSSGVLGQ